MSDTKAVAGKTAPAPSEKKKDTTMNDAPAWVGQLLKGGGWAAGLGLFYLAVLMPLREDFTDFKKETATGIQKLQTELKDLNKAITGDLRDRLATANQRLVTLEERVRSIDKRLENVERPK